MRSLAVLSWIAITTPPKGEIGTLRSIGWFNDSLAALLTGLCGGPRPCSHVIRDSGWGRVTCDNAAERGFRMVQTV